MGLGNPGPDYQDTRHNAGFWFLEQWAGLHGLSFRKPWFRPFVFAETKVGDDLLVLVKPLTFMNHSGLVLDALFRRFRARPDSLLVVFDQMDHPPGRVRLKPHGSHAGHNGLKSIDGALAGQPYHRLAVGIGRPAPGTGVVDHVLGRPSDEDRRAIDVALTRTVSRADSTWTSGWESLINAVNQRNDPA